MSINYPTSLDSFTNPTPTDYLDSPSHSGQHSDANDAIEALEAKVGINGSTVITSHDKILATGWIPAGETWTYASATTFTISGDKTDKYQKGDKIKFSQTTDGQKYMYIIGVSYSSPNTTITVTGGSDYDLDNETISSPYFSKAENPQGFPQWFNFAAPTWNLSDIDDGSGGQPSTASFTQKIVGNTVYGEIRLTTNNAYKVGTGLVIRFTPPISAVGLSNTCIGSSFTPHSINRSPGAAVLLDDGDTIASYTVSITDNTQLTTVAISYCYEF
jgi:hypothetical protein